MAVGKVQARKTEWLEASLASRMRYETLDGQFRAGGNGGDQLLSLRTLLKVDADLEPLLVTFEVEDSRQYLADAGTPLSTGFVNALELLQAKVTWEVSDLFVEGSRSRLSAGRMTMDLGSRRLVARNRFRNTINAFTGIDWQWQIDRRQTLWVFYALPVARLPSDRPALLDNNARFDREDFGIAFSGIYYEAKDLPFGGTGELFLLRLDEDDTDWAATRNRRLYTPGFRYYRKAQPGKYDFEIEAALQFGKARAGTQAGDTTDLDVSAEFFHVSAGYLFEGAWKPHLVVLYDYASGDDDPNDSEYNRFDTLYGARRFDFGPTGINGAFARSNLSTPGWRLTVDPAERVNFMFAHRAFWLASATDAWTTSRVRDASGSSGRFVGQQIEFRLRWKAIPGRLDIEAGASHLFAGRFAQSAPNATGEGDTTYTYFQTTLRF